MLEKEKSIVRFQRKVIILAVVIICAVCAAMMLSNTEANAVSKPGKPSVTVLTDSSDSITVYWNKVKGASGYQIWRGGSKGGTYRKVKTFKSGSIVKWTNRYLTEDKEYYYKVRAYKNYTVKKKGKKVKKTIYGSYSKPDYAVPMDAPFCYAAFDYDTDMSNLSYIDCVFENYTTKNIVFKPEGCFVMDFTEFDPDDENTYEDCTLYESNNNDYLNPDEVVVSPGESVKLRFETDEYFVNFYNDQSVLQAEVDYYGDNYLIYFSNAYDLQPDLFNSSPKTSSKTKSIPANHKSVSSNVRISKDVSVIK